MSTVHWSLSQVIECNAIQYYYYYYYYYYYLISMVILLTRFTAIQHTSHKRCCCFALKAVRTFGIHHVTMIPHVSPDRPQPEKTLSRGHCVSTWVPLYFCRRLTS